MEYIVLFAALFACISIVYANYKDAKYKESLTSNEFLDILDAVESLSESVESLKKSSDRNATTASLFAYEMRNFKIFAEAFMKAVNEVAMLQLKQTTMDTQEKVDDYRAKAVEELVAQGWNRDEAEVKVGEIITNQIFGNPDSIGGISVGV